MFPVNQSDQWLPIKYSGMHYCCRRHHRCTMFGVVWRAGGACRFENHGTSLDPSIHVVPRGKVNCFCHRMYALISPYIRPHNASTCHYRTLYHVGAVVCALSHQRSSFLIILVVVMSKITNPLLELATDTTAASWPGARRCLGLSDLKVGVLAVVTCDLDRVTSVEGTFSRTAVVIIHEMCAVLHLNRTVVVDLVGLQGAIEREAGLGFAFLVGVVVLLRSNVSLCIYMDCRPMYWHTFPGHRL